MAYITKRGNSYSVRYTYEDEHGKSCDKWESFPTKEEATNRKKQIEHELAAQAVQQTQVGTQNLRIQPFHHPEPDYPLYRQHGDAEAQALPHGEPLHDPEQNALRFVYRGKEAGTDRKAEEAVSIRHDDPRGSSAAGYSLPVCRRVGHPCQKPCSRGQPQEVHAGAHHLDGRGNASGTGQHGEFHPASGSPPHTGGRTARG